MNYDIEEFCCSTCLTVNTIKAMFAILELKEDDGEDDHYSSVAIICKEDLAEQLLREFLNVEVNGFEFSPDYLEFDKDAYDKEYAITIDTDGNLSLMKAHVDDEYFVFDEDLVFISDECSSKILIEQSEYDEDSVFSFCIQDNEE